MNPDRGEGSEDDSSNPRSADLCCDFSQYVLVDIHACKDEDSEGYDDSSLSSSSCSSTAAGDQVDQDEASHCTYEDSECSDADHLFADVEDEATVVTYQSAAATVAKLERKEKELKGETIHSRAGVRTSHKPSSQTRRLSSP